MIKGQATAFDHVFVHGQQHISLTCVGLIPIMNPIIDIRYENSVISVVVLKTDLMRGK